MSPETLTIIGTLAVLNIALFAWLRLDIKTDRAEAAADRRAFQAAMDTFRTEMQRLAERQSNLEGARTAASD